VTRVAVALQDPLVLLGARAAVDACADCTVCGTADRLDALWPLLAEQRPDVLVLDKAFEHDEPGTLAVLARDWPQVRLLVYVHHTAAECLLRVEAERSQYQLSAEALEKLDCCLLSLEAGARGCLAMGSTAEQLLTAIRAIMAGEIAAAPWLSARFSVTRTERGGVQKLSARQFEVVRLVARGLSNKAIARELGIKEQTVKNHLAQAGRVVGLSNRLELALFVLQQRMVTDARRRTALVG
jgi:DNA-binding NarL/FixJ family response regulator